MLPPACAAALESVSTLSPAWKASPGIFALKTWKSSDACSFDVYVNDAKAGSLSNVPGATVTMALEKRFFVVGNNKVELRFVSSSGTVYTDAIQLVRTQSGDYYATDLDQSDCAFGRYEIENGAEARQPTSIHFDVPDAIAGKDSCRICVTIRFKCNSNQDRKSVV